MEDRKKPNQDHPESQPTIPGKGKETAKVSEIKVKDASKERMGMQTGKSLKR